MKCKFCLEILNQEEKDSNTNICNDCKRLIGQVPNLLNKMDQHIQIVNNFIKKYSPNEVNITKAISFLKHDYDDNSTLIYSNDSVDSVYKEMSKFGIKISGKMLIATFIPRVVEIIKYSTLKKVNTITEATLEDRLFLHKYWQDHYSYTLPDDWIYVIHFSFIHRRKTIYEEKFYDFPSCVIDKFFTLCSENPIPEIFYKVLTTEEFFTTYHDFSQAIDLENLVGIEDTSNLKNSIPSETIISILSEFQETILDWETSNRLWNPIRYDYFYYNKNENFFIVISYYEMELLIIKNLLKFIEINNKIPQSFDIDLVRRKQYPDYLKIIFKMNFNSQTLTIYDGNYGIADIHEFYNELAYK